MSSWETGASKATSHRRASAFARHTPAGAPLPNAQNSTPFPAMKLPAHFALALAVLAAPLAAAPEGWTTELPAAQEQARTGNKLVLINFTGSDWCPWCFRLRDEIFATKQFKDYAARNLVLVEADFPRKKPQSAALKQANQALQKKYGIRGYPTVIVLDSAGKKVGQLGYLQGGPAAFLAALDKLKK